MSWERPEAPELRMYWIDSEGVARLKGLGDDIRFEKKEIAHGHRCPKFPPPPIKTRFGCDAQRFGSIQVAPGVSDEVAEKAVLELLRTLGYTCCIDLGKK